MPISYSAGGGIPNTASNGLHEVGLDIRLGGGLTEDTDIETNGHDFTVDGNPIGGGGLQTADNGLTATGTNVALGGPLTGATQIDLDGNFMQIGVGPGFDDSLLVTPSEMAMQFEGGLSGFTTKSEVTSASVTLNLTEVSSGNQLQIVLNPGGMTITDSLTGTGLEYAADYSAGFVGRSLPDVAFVMAAIASAIAGIGAVTTASQGLTKTGSDVALGGTLTGDVELFPGSHQIKIDMGSGGGLEVQGPTAFFFANNDTVNAFTNGTGDLRATLLAQNGVASLRTENKFTSSVYAGINAVDTNLFVVDLINVLGLVNGGDYEANFVARSLVTKQYVDALIPAFSTADNGLQIVGSAVELGGNLTGNTTIGVQGFLFDIIANAGGDTGSMVVEATEVNMSVEASTNVKEISLATAVPGAVITDDIDSLGALYAGDYEANFVNRSLVTKQYVDALIPAGGGPVIVRTDTILAQNTTQFIVSYALNPASASTIYRWSVGINVTAITGTANIVVVLLYTDINGNSQSSTCIRSVAVTAVGDIVTGSGLTMNQPGTTAVTAYDIEIQVTGIVTFDATGSLETMN